MSSKSDKFKPFDVADYLVDLDDIAGYLEGVDRPRLGRPPERSGRSPARTA